VSVREKNYSMVALMVCHAMPASPELWTGLLAPPTEVYRAAEALQQTVEGILAQEIRSASGTVRGWRFGSIKQAS
jgi:hypothetical protein